MRRITLILTFALLLTTGAQAQQRDSLSLSLEQALARAFESSQEIRLAQTQSTLAAAQVREARSAALPQVSTALQYSRAIKSSFDTGGGGGALPDSLMFDPDPNKPLEERVSYLEDKTPIAAIGALSGLFSDLPFGRDNTYTVGLQGQQVLYSGGKVGSALRIARHYQEAADLGVLESRSDIALEVRQAYYQAKLAQELINISHAAVQQAEAFLAQERLREENGRASDLEVMRAEVSLENLRPQLVEAQNAGELSMLNLKRLLNLPMDQPLRLTTDFSVPAPEVVEDLDVQSDLARAANRPALRALQETVAIRNEQVRIARGNYLPSVALSTSYAKLLYPSNLVAFNEDWRTDWTVSLAVSVPLFQGFARSAQVQQARVQLEQARLELEQTQEAVQLQYEQARNERARAQALIAARQRTIEQAARVYDLTVMRYDKGLATQLEVSEARLALLSARTNLVQALSDYYLAEANVERALGNY